MIRSRSRGLYHLHALITLLALPVLFVVAAALAVRYFDRYTHDFINYPLYLIGIFASGFVYFSFFQNLPTFSGRLPLPQVLRITNYEVLVLAFVLFGIVFTTKDKAISRTFLGGYILLSAGMLFLFNALLPQCLSRLLFRGSSLRTCLLVGNTHSAKKVKDWFDGQDSLGLNIVGLVNGKDARNEMHLGIPCLGSVDDLSSIIRTHRANQVILLENHNDPAWVDSVRRSCDREGCRLLLYNPWSDYFDRPLIAVSDGKHAFFAFQEEPLESPFNRVVKRLFDLMIAIPVVVVLLPILVAVVKFYHKKQSPGPLLHEQTRSGLNRNNFKIYKFRSMHVKDSENEESDENARSFPFGRFMRRHSIDEVPQFLNVLLGHMSVVGPRPHMIQHDALFIRYVDIYKQRHFIRPGLTGLAQVNGLRGELTDVEKLKQRVDYDLEYMYTWSLLLDISIVIKTFWHMLKPPPSAG